jgi:hypothetical protein
VFARNNHVLARDNSTKELISENIVKVNGCDSELLNADMEIGCCRNQT